MNPHLDNDKKLILLTGATGYIGSHTWVELLAAGYEVLGRPVRHPVLHRVQLA